MKLDKAIEIQELNVREAGLKMPPDVLKALILSTQVLKHILAWRNDNDEDLLWDIPGETED